MQRLAILGSTGSIGRSVLEVVRQHPERLAVQALAAYGSHPEVLVEQIREFHPPQVAVVDPGCYRALEGEIPQSVELLAGANGLIEVATHPEVDRVVASMVGAAGLPPVYAALKAGKDVALANKESMVVAGRLLIEVARQSGAQILPIDSEHAALHQALRCGSKDEVKRLVLTASGGPFRTRDRATWGTIRSEEALRHPTWEMGAKISIDSATLMNKGLELIEACQLFSFPEDRIDVVIHPQSIVHSFVEYCDGSWIAQMAANDMVIPIQYALSFPERWGNGFEELKLTDIGRLDFESLDEEKFRSIALARQALGKADSGPAVLNAANEVAVEKFLRDEIGFVDIVSTVEKTLEMHEAVAIESLEEALDWDRWGREQAREILVRP
jgi:1-deoxy-D-xylulose-5-phosphate reductoisomerase